VRENSQYNEKRGVYKKAQIVLDHHFHFFFITRDFDILPFGFGTGRAEIALGALVVTKRADYFTEILRDNNLWQYEKIKLRNK